MKRGIDDIIGGNAEKLAKVQGKCRFGTLDGWWLPVNSLATIEPPYYF